MLKHRFSHLSKHRLRQSHRRYLISIMKGLRDTPRNQDIPRRGHATTARNRCQVSTVGQTKMHFVILNFDSQQLPNSFYRRCTDPNVGSIKGELQPLTALPAFRVTREMRSKELLA